MRRVGDGLETKDWGVRSHRKGEGRGREEPALGLVGRSAGITSWLLFGAKGCRGGGGRP
jgi:hypothetical protein